jgi:hypothetical protein
MIGKLYATTHVCKLHQSVAYINQLAETEQVKPEKHLCMQNAEVSKLHKSSPCGSTRWINAISAPLKGCMQLYPLHTSTGVVL